LIDQLIGKFCIPNVLTWSINFLYHWKVL